MRIPFDPRAETTLPLSECIKHAADEAGVTTYRAAYVMSRFFESLIERVASGEVVRIAGLGTFGPATRIPRSAMEGDAPYTTPRFVPSRAFRAEVRTCCPPDKARDSRLRRYGKRQAPSSRPDHPHTLSATTMRRFRDELRSQDPWSEILP
jgi:nucleoid DNA-binding protein